MRSDPLYTQRNAQRSLVDAYRATLNASTDARHSSPVRGAIRVAHAAVEAALRAVEEATGERLSADGRTWLPIV